MIEAEEKTKGYEVGYDLFTHQRQDAGPGRAASSVKQGERVLFHVLNASATEIRSLALPGHTLPCDRARRQPRAQSGGCAGLMDRHCRAHLGDRRDEPSGRLVMGDLADDDRRHGMGIVVEYGGRSGKP